jgi:hypothetical protein
VRQPFYIISSSTIGVCNTNIKLITPFCSSSRLNPLTIVTITDMSVRFLKNELVTTKILVFLLTQMFVKFILCPFFHHYLPTLINLRFKAKMSKVFTKKKQLKATFIKEN